MLWYSRSLFDEAGLNYPPHTFGEKYTMPDGTQVDWNYDTISTLGKLLTVDKNGKDATMSDFDPNTVEQWGFDPQRDDLRYVGGYWGLARSLATTARRYDSRHVEGGLEVFL